VKGDVTIPELKRPQYGAHPASVEFAEDATENFRSCNGSTSAGPLSFEWHYSTPEKKLEE
jgi:hypothetical protein